MLSKSDKKYLKYVKKKKTLHTLKRDNKVIPLEKSKMFQLKYLIKKF